MLNAMVLLLLIIVYLKTDYRYQLY
jgi:hypothetical protein